MDGYMELVMRAKKGLWVWEMALKSGTMVGGRVGTWFYFPFGRIRDEHFDKLVDVERERAGICFRSLYTISTRKGKCYRILDEF